MNRLMKKSALILCFLLAVAPFGSAWAGTPTPVIKTTPMPKFKSTPTPKPSVKPTPTPKATSAPSATARSFSKMNVAEATPTSMATPTSASSMPATPKPKGSAQLVRARVGFFNSESGTVKTVLKSFYWINLPSGPRRFDAVLPPTAFRKNSVGKWVVSSEVVELTKRMAARLYEDTDAKVISYFGQYEPDIIRDEVRLTTGINEGIDFSASPQDAVFRSLTSGTVTMVVSSGNSDELSYCAIRTDDGRMVFYAHAIVFFVKQGDRVGIGTQLGRQGDRGCRGTYQINVSMSGPDAEQPAAQNDTKVTNKVPYSYWEKVMAQKLQG